MKDLDARLRTADQIDVTDLWPDITDRRPQAPAAEHTRRRWPAMVVALAIGLGVVVSLIAAITTRSTAPISPAIPAPSMTNGLIAFSGGTSMEIVVMDPTGSQRTVIIPGGTEEGTSEHPFPAYEPAWSPDGTRIAFRGFWGHGEQSDLFVANADGSEIHQLTTNGAEQPSWSPDGTSIAFGTWNGIYVIGADGSGLHRLTPESGLWHDSPSWSPDGPRIAFVIPIDGIYQVFSIATDGGDMRKLTNFQDGATSPSWSPDGSQIAFVRSDPSGGSDIYVMNADGTGSQPITTCDPTDCSDDGNPSWSPDGSLIVFDRSEGGSPGLYTVRPDGSDLTLLARNAFDAAWQPVSSASPTLVSQISAEITQTIDTGLRFPEGVVVDDSGVWVVTRHGTSEGGDLLRLDPGTGDVVARISLPTTPGWEFGGAGITTGLGSVWVAASGGDQHTSTVVYRIDTSTDSLAETIDVGAGDAADVWVDDGGIWVLSFADSGDALWLYHLDQTTQAVLSRTTIPANWSNTVVGAGGWIWVLGNTDDSDGAPPGTLFRIDPTSGEIVDRSDPAGGESFFLTASGDRLWFVQDGELHALDANAGTEAIAPLGLPETSYSTIVSDDTGGVWVISGRRGASSNGVWHVSMDGIIDRRSDEEPGELADGIAAAFDPSTASVWIVHYENTVSRLEIKPVG
jgi:Tol biopolymer transport system component